MGSRGMATSSSTMSFPHRPSVRSTRSSFRNYKDQIRDQEAADSLEVGARRSMIPLHFSGGLGAPQIFANPYVLTLVRMILDNEAIIDAFGAILLLSGAEDQHIMTGRSCSIPRFRACCRPMP